MTVEFPELQCRGCSAVLYEDELVGDFGEFSDDPEENCFCPYCGRGVDLALDER